MEELCRGHAPEWAAFLSYARHLAFKEQPDYAYMRKARRQPHAPRPTPHAPHAQRLLATRDVSLSLTDSPVSRDPPQLFRDVFVREGFVDDGAFDWSPARQADDR